MLMTVCEFREDDKKTVFREVLSRSVFSKSYKKMKILVKRYYVHSVNYSL